MITTVIESPYQPTDTYSKDDAHAYLQRCIADSLSRNESPYASHLMLTQVLDDQFPHDRAFGIHCGHEWYRCADLVVFYTDLGWSTGMLEALKKVKEIDKPYTERTILNSP